MKNSFKLLAVVFMISGLVSCGKEDDKQPDPVNNNIGFYSKLKGSSEVPANNSTASGTAAATFNQQSKILTVTTTYSGMTATAGHIHKGDLGVAGAVVFPFVSTTSPIVFTSTALGAAQEADLMAGLYYINIHSTTFPGGEIRGQLFRDNIVGFTAVLSGANEVPANGSTATGVSVAAFNKDSKILTITTTYSGLTVTAGHVHNGDAGVAGPVVFPFTNTASPIVLTTAALDATQEADLMSGHYYVNLHSTAFPGGEIRGQLLKD